MKIGDYEQQKPLQWPYIIPNTDWDLTRDPSVSVSSQRKHL